MKIYPKPENEQQRLEALKDYRILDSLPEKEFDAITELASFICGTPIALVSLIDENRQWFKSNIGIGASETSRKDSFCQYTILNDEVFEVSNATEHWLFYDNPLVTGDPNIRFYAGAPLVASKGLVMGSLCVIDTVAKSLTLEQKKALQLLANQVVSLLDARKKNQEYGASQKELQNFIDLSKDLVCIANINGLFYKVNPSFTTVLGYSKEEIEGKPFIDFVHPEDLSVTLKEVEKLSNFTLSLSFENRYRCKDGTYKTLSWSSSPDPETGNLYCIARDVTKEKAVAKRLLEVNTLLEESQKIAKIGTWNFNYITNDIFWSEEHFRIFEMEKMPAEELFAVFRSRIHPEDLVPLETLITDVLSTGVKFETTYRIVLPGDRIKYIFALGQPIIDEDGKTVALTGMIQDITEITIAELSLSQKDKEIKDIRAALDEAAIVSIANKKGALTYVNDNFCIVSQYSRDELLGKEQPNMAEFFLKDFGQKILSFISEGKTWKGEIKNIAKDGSFYWENRTIVPFVDENNIPYQYISISTDITARKIAEENLITALGSLKKTNRELDEYAHVVSHDLKSPLRAIYNLSEFIAEDMPEMPPKVQQHFDMLRSRVSRMENLINGVLQYSRVGRVQIEKEEVDVKHLVESIVEGSVPDAHFEVIIGDNFPVITAEKILLQQVFGNLIGNAVKYNDKAHGKIECLYNELSSFHEFTVKDNGLGIDEAYYDKIFNVFQTIEARDIKESTGIGLSIVKKIIEEKGGAITVESKIGEGSSFIFTYPKTEE